MARPAFATAFSLAWRVKLFQTRLYSKVGSCPNDDDSVPKIFLSFLRSI